VCSHVSRTMSRCFAVLYQLRTIWRQVPTAVFQSRIIALVLPHLDYCNSALYGLPTSLIRRLHSVQNATAQLIFGIQRSEHTTPALISLHWLCVFEHFSFKLAVLKYQAIHGTGPFISSSASLMWQTCRYDDNCVHLAQIACTYCSSIFLQSALGSRTFPVSGAAV